MSEKKYNTVYTTLFGGYSMGMPEFPSKIQDFNAWEYTCIYGKLRFNYSCVDLKDGWIHRSIHWNNVINEGITWNFHIAYRKKFPFIKIGFNSIKDLFI